MASIFRILIGWSLLNFVFWIFPRFFLRDFKLQTTKTLRRRVKNSRNQMRCKQKMLLYRIWNVLFCFSVSITGGQDDFFAMNNHLLNGIDVSQVQDIDRVNAIDLPTVTDSSGKPLLNFGLYSGPYFDLRTMPKNQTVQIGENALIHCAVKQVGEKSVNLEKLYTRLHICDRRKAIFQGGII